MKKFLLFWLLWSSMVCTYGQIIDSTLINQFAPCLAAQKFSLIAASPSVVEKFSTTEALKSELRTFASDQGVLSIDLENLLSKVKDAENKKKDNPSDGLEIEKMYDTSLRVAHGCAIRSYPNFKFEKTESCIRRATATLLLAGWRLIGISQAEASRTIQNASVNLAGDPYLPFVEMKDMVVNIYAIESLKNFQSEADKFLALKNLEVSEFAGCVMQNN